VNNQVIVLYFLQRGRLQQQVQQSELLFFVFFKS